MHKVSESLFQFTQVVGMLRWRLQIAAREHVSFYLPLCQPRSQQAWLRLRPHRRPDPQTPCLRSPLAWLRLYLVQPSFSSPYRGWSSSASNNWSTALKKSNLYPAVL